MNSYGGQQQCTNSNEHQQQQQLKEFVVGLRELWSPVISLRIIIGEKKDCILMATIVDTGLSLSILSKEEPRAWYETCIDARALDKHWKSDLGWSGRILPFVKRFDNAIRKRIPVVVDDMEGGGKILVLSYCIPGDGEDVIVEGVWRFKRDESDLSPQLVDSLWLHITTNHQAIYNNEEADNTPSIAFGRDSEHTSTQEKEKRDSKEKCTQSPASGVQKKRPCYKQSGLDPTKRKASSRLAISP